MADVQGWPFLVARGFRCGYTVLLTPDFLGSQYGLLAEIAGAGRRLTTTTVNGRPLTVVWSEHKVTGPDVGSDEGPRDEHGRPLHLLHGFVCEVSISELSEVDMSRSLAAALDIYRQFLSNEERFTIKESGPFPLHSVGTPRPGLALPSAIRWRVPAALAGLVAVVALAIVVLASSGGTAPEPSTPPPTSRTSTTET